MGMTGGQLRNCLFLCESADGAGEFHHAVSIGCRFFYNFTFAEGVELGIKPVVTSVAAGRPVFICVIFKLA